MVESRNLKLPHKHVLAINPERERPFKMAAGRPILDINLSERRAENYITGGCNCILYILKTFH